MGIKKDFENKIAIVTGGGTGIGKETARELLAGGAKVVINGRREEILRDAAHELDPGGKLESPATPVRSLSRKDSSQSLSSASAD